MENKVKMEEKININEELHKKNIVDKSTEKPILSYVLVAMVVLVVVLSVFQSFQISSFKDEVTSQINSLKTKVSSSGGNSLSGPIDMTGWTADEKMQYEHHGVMPARLKSGQQSSSSGMVGGC